MESDTKAIKRVNITIPVEPALRDAIREAAKNSDRQLSDFCRVVLRRALMGGESPAPAIQPETAKATQQAQPA